jgi:hypothetical protein
LLDGRAAEILCGVGEDMQELVGGIENSDCHAIQAYLLTALPELIFGMWPPVKMQRPPVQINVLIGTLERPAGYCRADAPIMHDPRIHAGWRQSHRGEY